MITKFRSLRLLAVVERPLVPIGCDLGRGPPNGRRRKAVAAAVRRRWGRIRLSARRSVCEVPFAAAGWQAPQAHSVSSARLTACVPFVIVHRSPRRSEIGGVVLLPPMGLRLRALFSASGIDRLGTSSFCCFRHRANLPLGWARPSTICTHMHCPSANLSVV